MKKIQSIKSESSNVSEVSPALAKQWLELASDRAKPASEFTAIAYARTMLDGTFPVSTLAVGFDVNGRLMTGLTELRAVILANVSQRFIVAKNLSIDALVLVQDPRMILTRTHGLDRVSGRGIGAANWITKQETGYTKLNPFEQVQAYLTLRPMILRAETVFNTTMVGVCQSSVLAAVARAMVTNQSSSLAHFCSVLISGESVSHRDRIIVKLRKRLYESAVMVGKGLNADRSYRLTQAALRHWIDDDATETLTEAKTELFPLPSAQIKKLKAA